MAQIVSTLFQGFFRLLLVAGGLLYAGLVLMSYRTDGGHFRLKFDLRDPARSAERLLVWLGVRAIDTVIRLAKPVYYMLAEASAEVGEWFIRRRSPEVQAALRSRFMV
jgi:hypothetical protein